MGIASFLLNQDDMNEARESSIEKNGELFNKIREFKPELHNIEDRVINNILTIYCRDMNISKNEVDPAEFVDWLSLFNSYGEFIFEYRNELALKNLEDLGTLDPRFIRAITLYGKKYKYIDQNGRDIANADNEAGKVLSNKELMRSIFDDSCRSSSPEERVANEDHFDDDLFNDVIDEIQEIYNRNAIGEDLEEDVDMGEIPPSVEPVEEPKEEASPVEMPEPSEEVKVAANNDMIQSLINDCWSFITNANGVIATLEFNNFTGDKEAIKTLLNDIVDQTTINIGMLHKVANMVDTNTAELIAAGEDKAEEKIGE